MRSLGYSLLLATALVVAPACNKKDGDAKADGGEKKADDKAADGGAEAKPADGGGVAAAAGGPTAATAKSLELIPDTAEFVVGLSPKAITASPFWGAMAPELEKEPDFKSTLDAFKSCNVDPLKFESVTAGIGMTEDFAAVVVGDGIGDEKNASCIVQNLQKQAGDAQAAEVVTKDGKKMIEFTDGSVYLVDGRTLAITTPGWKDAVAGLIDGKGTSATAGSKKELFGKVDATANIWGIGNIPAEIAGMAPMLGAPPEFSSVRGVTGSIDLSDGAAIQTLAVFDSADTAKKVADQLQTMVKEAGGQAPPELANVVKSVKIEAAGTDLKIAMNATMDDINKAKAVAPPI